ncbi:hypothetical protein BDZ94DRAFT_1271676, partial [Collybia nuda]
RQDRPLRKPLPSVVRIVFFFCSPLIIKYILLGSLASRRWMGSLLVYEGYHPRQMFDCMFPSVSWSFLSPENTCE